MLAQAAFPFRTSGSTTLRSASALEPLLRDWLSEASARRISSVGVYSSAGLRAAIGQVPAGFSADPDLLFALARVGGDAFVAVMQPSGARWKITGLVRL
jgi:hypothetical protein